MDPVNSLPINPNKNIILFWFITFLAVIGPFLQPLINYLAIFFYGSSKEDEEIKEEIVKLKKDLKNVNMMDEFAKHAKIQRKINTLTQNLNNQNIPKLFSGIKLKLACYIIFYSITGIIMMYISWTYKYVPLLILKNKNMFYPFNSLLAFPTGTDGAIGIIPWITIVTQVSRSFINFFKQPTAELM